MLSGENGILYLWNLSRGEAILLGEVRPASKAEVSAAFSPRGGILAAADSLPGILRLYDLSSLSPRSEIRVPSVRAVAFSPDGKYLAAGGSGELMLRNMETGETWTIPVSSRMTSLVFLWAAENDEVLLAGGMEDGSILLWNPDTLDEPVELSARGNPSIWSMSASGALLATLAGVSTIGAAIWRAVTTPPTSTWTATRR